MTTLARKLRLIDYFALGFGVMVGTAWLVVMDDLLQRGGPLGAILGFTVGALMLLPIGYVYGQLVMAIPDAAAEVAYTARFFSPQVSFVAGWMMFLSYFLTCPFEALAAGRIAGYMFPSMNTLELYRLGGRPVYLPHLILGLAITVLLTWLNYRGIQASARFLKWSTFTFLTLVMIFGLAGAKHGAIANLRPWFSHSPVISVLLVWQVVPWLLAGFESVGKCAEEASPDFQGRDFSVAIMMTILVGLFFFWVVILAVAYVAPWQSLDSSQPFPTAVAFERALHAHWIVTLILASALVALLKAFNANLVASSRLLFAMGRRNLLAPRMGHIHPANQTPSTAVIVVGVASALALFLGQAGLVPILEVGAVASAVGWMAACASFYCMKPPFRGRAAAIVGLWVTSLMILVKVVPVVPGHFTRYEWMALALWGALGASIRVSGNRNQEVSAKSLGLWGLLGLLGVSLGLVLVTRAPRAAETSGFNGARAFEDLRRLVAFGPRPSGSKALEDARQWITRQLMQAGVQVEKDHFQAALPARNTPMTNLLAKIPGARPQVVIVAGHYDTKQFDNFAFVGANDGGSSAAFLLELARVLSGRKNSLTFWLVFFDGEDTFQEGSPAEGLYGSRHLVEKLTESGELGRVQALILVDMIADGKLDIHRESNSTPWLTDLVFNRARRLGYTKYFQDEPIGIEDDHIPFVNAGVSAVDLIDFDYGPNNSYWHTPQDTPDHCSPFSLTIVGRVVMATLEELEKSPRIK